MYARSGKGCVVCGFHGVRHWKPRQCFHDFRRSKRLGSHRIGHPRTKVAFIVDAKFAPFVEGNLLIWKHERRLQVAYFVGVLHGRKGHEPCWHLRKSAVADRDARKTFRIESRDPQSDQAPPILHEQVDVVELECIHKAQQSFGMTEVAVRSNVRRFVGTSHAQMVHCDHAKARIDENRNHVPIEVRPGGLTMQQQDHRSIRRSLVDVGLSQTIDLRVLRRIGPIRESLKARFGSADKLDALAGRANHGRRVARANLSGVCSSHISGPRVIARFHSIVITASEDQRQSEQ